jgi:diguanylate cyclase (GGDEF)-like protein
MALAVAVAVPVIIAVAVLMAVVPASLRHHTDAQVAEARASATQLVADTCAQLTQTATMLARATGTGRRLDSAVEAAADADGTAAELLGPDGAVLASAASQGTAVRSFAAVLADAPGCASAGTALVPGTAGTRVLAARVPAAAGGTAVVAMAIDPGLSPQQNLLATVARLTGADVTLAVPAAGSDPAATASTLHHPGGLLTQARMATDLAVPQQLDHGGGVTAGVVGLPLGSRLLVSRRTPDTNYALGLIVVGGLLVIALAYAVGRRIAAGPERTLRELSRAAERVTAGDLDVTLPPGDGEPGRLAAAFNTMTEALRRTITDLRTSRDELQRNVSRLGDTLSGTHDLDRILRVILETAMASVRATGGVVLLTGRGGEELYLRAALGAEGRLADDGGPLLNRVILTRNGGVIGTVAATGHAVRGRIGVEGLALAADEPAAATVMAVPLRSGGNITGVLALYDRGDGQPFDDRDLQIVESFTSQAVPAVDNVLLHQEAQRLSITDGLTGLWNYRYAVVALAREVERAARFERPLAVLMLDLDRFKRVNDRYGHQRGDAVLLEVANRVSTVVREVDILARYGGEELILIAPETDVSGAETLAAKVREVVRAIPMGGPDEEAIEMTTSVGIAVQPLHGDTARSLLRAADAALYEAKAAGRDRWRLARVDRPVLPDRDAPLTPTS